MAQHICILQSSGKKYPGKVWVQFVVDEQGKVMQPQIVKGIDPLLDQEALRIVKLMPDWKPAQQNGKSVEASFLLPLDFSIPVKQGKGIIVVDGKLMPEDFNVATLSLDEVESITVLKGEKAVALYGEKAKEREVLLINTQKVIEFRIEKGSVLKVFQTERTTSFLKGKILILANFFLFRLFPPCFGTFRTFSILKRIKTSQNRILRFLFP
ncbi:MAG: TonB family protein [Odoribacter splanchnicus]